MERTVHVELGERSYPIRIGADILAKAGPEVVRRTGATRAVIVSVPPVSRRYGPRLTRSLREAGLKVHRIDVPDGDRTKNLRQVGRLYQQLLAARADRGTVLLALGGGVVGDLTGFVAATYLRGIPYVQVPTTLLAMVDASVGGKTGVNLPEGKNLVGAFYQPRLVLADASTLSSLPPRLRAAGFAEVIKKAAIRDAEQACHIKAAIVAEDERESGTRMLLNFGHTLAHAVERLSGYRRVLHGEAVAMGMAFAARRSEELGHAPGGIASRLVALLERAGLGTELPEHPRRAYLEALAVDKKRREARIHFVVLTGLGSARTVPLTPREILASFRARARKGARR